MCIFFSFLLCFRLFRLEPSTQIQFKNIRHLETEDKLRMSEELEKHAGKMMTSIDDIVNNIDDVDYALDKMSKVAQQHKSFQGFTAQQFLVSVCFPGGVVCAVPRVDQNHVENIVVMATFLVFEDDFLMHEQLLEEGFKR